MEKNWGYAYELIRQNFSKLNVFLDLSCFIDEIVVFTDLRKTEEIVEACQCYGKLCFNIIVCLCS